MIKKAQIRFVAIMMTVLFVLLAILFAISYNVISTSNNRAILSILNSENNFYRTSGKAVSETTLVLSFGNDEINSDSFAIVNGGGYFSDETINELIEGAQSVTEGLGIKDNIFFLVTSEDEQLFLIAIDASEELAKKNSAITTAILTLIALYLVLFPIIIGLSFSIFKPIKDNLYRQKRFISDASHEMRTPVAIISANADVLKNFIDNNGYLDSIKTQTKRLEKLVSDMLALAKTDEEKIVLAKEEFSVSDEVLEAVLPYEAILFENGKTLLTDVDANLKYVGDRQSFKTVLGILIDNAIKHSDKKATIKVSLKKEAGKITLKVFNTGSLIREEDSAKVFERFYRGDGSRSRDSGGSGLGLSIAKSLADANKWKISARSQLNVSMTMTLIL